MSSELAVSGQVDIKTRSGKTRRDLVRRSALYAFLIAGALLVLLPYIWMIITSLKVEQDMFQVGILKSIIPSKIRWANYAEAWNDYPLGRWLFNSATDALWCVSPQSARRERREKKDFVAV